jgi:DNA-binding CsgD family transcriptional regulator
VANKAELDDLLMQARITNRLLAASLKSTMKQQALIELLKGTGASNGEVADVLGTTPNTVNVALNRAKKKSK